MDVTTLFLYIVAVGAVMMAPGPSMLLAFNNGAAHGMRIARYGIAGALLSDVLLIGAVGCGLGALLQASEQLFIIVKWSGAGYLVYLAWRLWHSPTRALSGLSGSRVISGGSAFRRSLFVSLSNPKGVLFFSAFLPQFIQPDQPVALQYAVLTLVSASVDCVMLTIYALGGRHAMRRFSATMMQWVNRSCAGLLAVMAVGLSLYQRGETR